MKLTQLQKKILLFFGSCYLCGPAVGVVVAIIAFNMEESLAKKIVFGAALLLFAAGRIAFAVERDQARRREEKERQAKDRDSLTE